MLQPLLAAVWRRKPEVGLLLHSDQGCEFTSQDWQSFLKEQVIVCSTSGHGNCHENARWKASSNHSNESGLSERYTPHTTKHDTDLLTISFSADVKLGSRFCRYTPRLGPFRIWRESG